MQQIRWIREIDPFPNVDLLLLLYILAKLRKYRRSRKNNISPKLYPKKQGDK